jgi:hypothetical protein
VDAEPSTGFVDRIADQLIASNWELAPALKYIFNSVEFMSTAARFTLVKSPAEYVVGALRALNKNSDDDISIGLLWMSRAGQALYDPPNVGGWPSNMGWLGAAGVLARNNAGVQLADRHVGAATLPGQTRIRATTPEGWGAIFGVPDLSQTTIDAMNSYAQTAAAASATDPNAASEATLDAAMITLLVSSPDFILS